MPICRCENQTHGKPMPAPSHELCNQRANASCRRSMRAHRSRATRHRPNGMDPPGSGELTSSRREVRPVVQTTTIGPPKADEHDEENMPRLYFGQCRGPLRTTTGRINVPVSPCRPSKNVLACAAGPRPSGFSSSCAWRLTRRSLLDRIPEMSNYGCGHDRAGANLYFV